VEASVNSRAKKIVISASLVLVSAILIYVFVSPIFYRLSVPAGCVGVLFESDALDELPADVLYATAQIVISTPMGDFGGAIVEVERDSRSFHIVCAAPGSYGLRDLRKRFWNLYYYMRNLSDSGRPAIALPTLSVFIYASSGEWLYIASTHFSAADLLLSATGAAWNPFAILDGSVVAVVSKVKFHAVNASEVLERLYGEAVKVGANVRAPWEPPNPDMVAVESLNALPVLAEPEQAGSASCPQTFFAVWNMDLYSSVNRTPPEWYSRVEPRSAAEAAWRIFASTLSTEYWCRADICRSSNSALRAAQSRYYFGFYSLSDYLGKIVGRRIHWRNTYPQGHVAKVEVPLGIVHSSSDGMLVQSGLLIYAGFPNPLSSRTGWALFGVLARGFDIVVRSHDTEHLFAYVSSAAFVLISSQLLHLYDSIVVVPAVYRGYYSGCAYWVVRPVFVVAPHYVLIPDAFRFKVITDGFWRTAAALNEWPPQLHELTWSARYVEVSLKRVQGAYGDRLYEESPYRISCPPEFALIAASIYRPMLDEVAGSVLGSDNLIKQNTAYSEILFYAVSTYPNNYIRYLYTTLIAAPQASNEAVVTVGKYTIPITSANLTRCGFAPTVLIWFSQVR